MSTDTADYKPSSLVAQLGGAKRKNGHKANCGCHICENMKNKAKRGGYKDDIERENLKRMGGSKKKNGHKPSCDCQICKNMKHSKKGGDNNSDEEEMSQNAGRKKKSNGHKMNCKCPICKNMKKRGGNSGQESDNEEPDIENQLGDNKDLAESKMTTSDLMDNENETYNSFDAAEKGEAGPNIVGGTRKRRGSRKSNGHKMNCGCPICKNMRHGKKTRRHRKRSHRRN